MGKRLKVLTVGCKANFADSSSVVRLAAAHGFDIASPNDPADVVIINSCTVTHRADRDSRSLARRARRENPSATVILTGCYAEVSRPDRDRLPEVDFWVGTGGRDAPEPDAGSLAGILAKIAENGRRDPVFLSDHAADRLLGRQRTFLKIQDGCDFACAYCVVPVARGRNRSVPEAEILERAAAAESDGAREIVLTGIRIGLYGTDRGSKEALPDLVRKILAATSRIRIRLGSIEPLELNGRLIDLVASNPRVCAHLHVPLQSGSDRTLSRMRRRYRSAEYEASVTAAAARIPGLSLGADVIAGFPDETDGDFEETVRFLRDSPVTYLHVFPYSARPGTESAKYPDSVSPPVKKERVSRLLSLDARMRDVFLSGQVGKTLDVLAETADRGGRELAGLSGNYVEVRFPGSASGIGEIHPVLVSAVREGRLRGTCI